jgi:hypothetical protein
MKRDCVSCARNPVLPEPHFRASILPSQLAPGEWNGLDCAPPKTAPFARTANQTHRKFLIGGESDVQTLPHQPYAQGPGKGISENILQKEIKVTKKSESPPSTQTKHPTASRALLAACGPFPRSRAPLRFVTFC